MRYHVVNRLATSTRRNSQYPWEYEQLLLRNVQTRHLAIGLLIGKIKK